MIGTAEKWLLYAFSLFFVLSSSLLAASIMILVGVVMHPWGARAKHMVLAYVTDSWLNALATWTNYMAPSEFVVTLDPERLAKAGVTDTLSQVAIAFGVGSGDFDPADPKNQRYEIVIANHQIYADWIYIWAFLNYLGRAGFLKIVLKRSIQFIPVYGLGMKVNGFVFLHRNWALDQVKFGRRIRRIGENGVPYNLLIFPEGTTMTEQARVKSQVYGKDHGLPHLKHCLLPRSTGLYFALKALSESNGERNRPVEGIFDLTIGYKGLTERVIPEDHFTLTGLYRDSFGPPQIHVNCSYIPIADIPLESQEAFTAWLARLYKRKDDLLEQFYTEGYFRGIESRPIPMIKANSIRCFWLYLMGILVVPLCISYIIYIVG